MLPAERLAWAERVGQRCGRWRRSGPGADCRGARQPAWWSCSHAPRLLRFELPLGGMTLRHRLRWYDERLRVRRVL